MLNPKIVKAPWTSDEDAMLLARVQVVGESAWKIVAEGIRGRTNAQYRYRWTLLKKHTKKHLARERRKSTWVSMICEPNEHALENHCMQEGVQPDTIDNGMSIVPSTARDDMDELFDMSYKIIMELEKEANTTK